MAAAQEAGKEVLTSGTVKASIALAAEGGAGQSAAQRGARGATVRRLPSPLRQIWAREPNDVKRLRRFARPPMGNFPCVLYANFDLFWAVENLHVCRQLATEGTLSAPQVGRVAAALLRRTRSRLSKWGFPQASAVLEKTAQEMEGNPASLRGSVLLRRLEDTVLYLCRLQSWVDAMLPWASMDNSLRLLGGTQKRR